MSKARGDLCFYISKTDAWEIDFKLRASYQTTFWESMLIGSIILLPTYADMMKDSPVTFPKKGALPARYPPPINGPRATMRKEKDYYIFRTPESSLEQIKQIQAETGQSQRIRPVYLHRFAVV